MWCHSIKACFNCHSNLSFDERSIAAHVPRDLPLYYGTDDGHLRAVLVSFCRYRARGLTESWSSMSFRIGCNLSEVPAGQLTDCIV